MFKRNILLLFLLSALHVSSQELLTLQQAIELALKNNYDIRIAAKREDIAAINNSPGNAGMLPRANITLTDNASFTNINQEFSNGLEVSQKGVTGNVVNPSFNISWTLFDGLKMFATKSRLKRLQEIGELNYKDTLQAVVAQTIVAYYDVVSAAQQLKAINQAIRISEERVKLADKKFQVGASSKVDLLQARVDLNGQKSALLQQQKTMEHKKAELNRLLVRPAETDFTTTDSIPVNVEPQLLTPGDLETSNFQLAGAAKNVEIARLMKKEAFSQFLPTLNVNGAYGFTRSQSSAGFALYNQSYGLSGGFTLVVPLFNGLNSLNQYKIAGIQVMNAQFQLDKARLQTKINFYRALRDFETSKEILGLETENISLATENLNIALERFRLGQSTAIELREAQRSFEDAQTRLVNARFAAKVAETELLRLKGELVK